MIFGFNNMPTAKMPHDCLTYQASSVTLQGEITRKTFAGRPNFESIEDGDEPETYWILHVTQPVCVDGDQNIPNGDITENDVTDIQLILDEKQYATYKELPGKSVSVTGKLLHAISGHHHTNLLMKVAEITGK